MPKATQGVLIECDAAVKQLILNLNSKGSGPAFLIEDLDETHAFVDATAIPRIRSELDKLLEENTYTAALEVRGGL